MLAPEIVFDNTNNYGIVPTESLLGFSSKHSNFMNINSTGLFDWLTTDGDFARSLTETPTEHRKFHIDKNKKSLKKGHHKNKHKKMKKCIYKLLKKKKKKSKHLIMMKKYLLPLILGLVAAKSLLVPLAFKALAIISFKFLLLLSILKLVK